MRLLLAAGENLSISSFERDDLLDFAEKDCKGRNPPAVELIRQALGGATRESLPPMVPQDASTPNEIAETERLLDAIIANEQEQNRHFDEWQQ